MQFICKVKSVIICIICKQDSFNEIKEIINTFKTLKSIGLKTDPCGTPLQVVCHELHFSPTWTLLSAGKI